MISELLTMVMKAPGSCARTKRRSFIASRRESTLVRIVCRLPEYAPQPKVTVAVRPSFLTMNSSTSRGWSQMTWQTLRWRMDSMKPSTTKVLPMSASTQ